MAKLKNKRSASSALADQLFPEDVEQFEILNLPPEQRKLHTESFDFTVSTLIDYLEKDHVFVPEFQRDYVWSDQQASRLIESLIIQCPIPVLYFAQTNEERLAVIDGNQRTKSIFRFIKNEYALKGLSAYPELNGQKFSQLDSRFKRHLLNRTLRCIVILKETHPQVQFDVFERLNTGSKPLTAQELRHGLYFGPFIEAIDNLGKNKNLQNLLPKKFTSRMKAEELVLKVIALAFDLENYYQPVSGFLNDFSKKTMTKKDDEVRKLISHFEKTFDLGLKVFGEKLLGKGPVDDERFKSFYVGLFEAQMVALGKLSDKKTSELLKNKQAIQTVQTSYEALFKDDTFTSSFTVASPNKTKLNLRISKIVEILK